MAVIMMTHLPHKPHAPHITTTGSTESGANRPTRGGAKAPYSRGKPRKRVGNWKGFRSSRTATKMHANEFQLRPTDKMGRCETVFIFIDMAFVSHTLSSISPGCFRCRRFCCQFA